MCVKVTVIRKTKYTSLCVSLSTHSEIFNKQSLKNAGYILPKILLMGTLGQIETAKNDFRMLYNCTMNVLASVTT